MVFISASYTLNVTTKMEKQNHLGKGKDTKGYDPCSSFFMVLSSSHVRFAQKVPCTRLCGVVLTRIFHVGNYMHKLDKAIFVTLFFSIFATITGVGIVVPLLPVFAHNLGAGGLYIGLIFGAFSLSRVFFLPYFGRLSDRK